MSQTLIDIRVVDTDSHVTEPPDLWTSRVSSKWGDAVPHVAKNPETGHSHWRIGDHWLMPVGFYATAGWKEFPPFTPNELDDVDAGSWNPVERLKRMDEYGLYAQVLYPNLIGFETPLFMRMGPELSLECTRAYNDFITEFAATDRKRFIPISMVPFWDLDAAVEEMKRCREMGHRGVLFANQYEKVGLPPFWDTYWDPVLNTAQDLGMSINFHVGFTSSTDGSAAALQVMLSQFSARAATAGTALGLMSNAQAIATIVTSGLCDRFPRLKFVSVESGFGFLPYLLESLDWHWKGYGAGADSELLPSEYFKRQVYGCFWFERQTLPLLEHYPDNFMFETDYPHPTSMSPGPCSPAILPKDHILSAFEKVPLEIARKALYGNAANVYGLED
jgi:predicted TIM-barrel fold metal-dependent hydrolase